MSLLNFWPSAREVDNCIRTEAETIDEAVLLAVHQPARIFKRSVNGTHIEDTSEQELLDALLADSGDGSAVIVSVTGPSGVGKSHMVRWLHAQLARHPRRDELVVILVPKTASLREVVERILKPLRGTQYEELRGKLTNAIEAVSLEDAPMRLATELELQLRRRFEEWKVGMATDRSLKEKAFHAQRLPFLLGDRVFREVMLQKGLERIVARAVSGGGESAAPPRFETDDLVWPEAPEFTHATRDAQVYYSLLCDHDGAARATAVEVLNGVVDQALRMVFRFEQALNGHTIEELVGAIRTQLLAEHKELVLLIEDFAALPGFQGPLLSMIIGHSDEGGKRVRAPIRTALAVTDGFMPQRDTILTRAKREWVIASDYASDEALIERLIEMAGRYLNAARWGYTAIRRQFEARDDQTQAGLYRWVKPYVDEHLDADDEDALEAFGRTKAGYHLFPLNNLALRSLCDQELKADGRMRFNPRAFINQVLRETLDKREWFEKNQFPQAGFKGGLLKSGAETDLDSLVLASTLKARLKPVLVHWCGNPTTLGEASPVPAGVFRAFGLPVPFSGAAARKQAQEPINGTDRASLGMNEASPGTSTLPPEPATARKPPSPFETEVDRWEPDSHLSQRVARETRTILGIAVARRLDLDPASVTKLIWLPYVDHGNPQTAPWFRLYEETGEVPGWLRKAMIGLARWSEGKHWNYPNAEDDYGFAQRLLDDFAPQVERHFAELEQQRLAAALHVGYRHNLLLGVAAVKSLPGAFEKMFAPIPAGFNERDFEPVDSSDNRSPTLGKVLSRARAARAELQSIVLQDAACFQGGGKTPLAIDYARLVAAHSIRPDESLVRPLLSDESRNHLTDLFASFTRVVDGYNAVLGRHGSHLVESLGVEFDKHAWIDTLKKTFGAAQLQVPDALRQFDYIALLDAMGKAALTELLENVRAALQVPADAEPEDRLRALAKVDMSLLLRTAKQLKRLEEGLDEIDRRLRGEEAAAAHDPVEDVRARFQEELTAAALLAAGDTK